jgi:hypothetical protein
MSNPAQWTGRRFRPNRSWTLLRVSDELRWC